MEIKIVKVENGYTLEVYSESPIYNLKTFNTFVFKTKDDVVLKIMEILQ